MKSTMNIEVTTKSHITDSDALRSTLKDGAPWVFVNFTYPSPIAMWWASSYTRSTWEINSSHYPALPGCCFTKMWHTCIGEVMTAMQCALNSNSAPFSSGLFLIKAYDC